MRNDVPGQFCVTEKLDCVALTKNIALTGIGLIQRSCTDPRGREKSGKPEACGNSVSWRIAFLP